MNKKEEEKFLELISEECHLDKVTIKDVYMGLLRALGRNLRREGRFSLPDLVNISVVDYKPKVMFNKYTNSLVTLPETKRVKAVLNYKLKKFLKT